MVKLKSSLRKVYGRRHELVDRYGLTVSQMISDMFFVATIPFPFINVTYRFHRICYHISNTTGTTCWAGSAYPSGTPEITPSFWWGSCCLLFSFLCCDMCNIVCLFVLFIFSHSVVSLFSIYEFDCPSGIWTSCCHFDMFPISVLNLFTFYK